MFYVHGRGWVAAGDLNVGDEVYLIDGSAAYVTGAELEQLEEPITVYNLEVEGLNTYFVGDDGFLVHNYQDVNDKPKEDHHIATKYGEWGKKFKAIFDKYNIPMDDESNMVNLHHRGRHAKEYHELIYVLLQDFDDIADSDAGMFRSLLRSLGEWLINHNDLLYPGGWGR